MPIERVHASAGFEARPPAEPERALERMLDAGLAPAVDSEPSGEARLVDPVFVPASQPPGRSPLAVRAAEAIAERAPYSLPDRAALGACTIHRYEDPRVVASKITISGFVPLPSPELPGFVLDLNAKRFEEIIPHRCVLSDLGHTRAFVGIDERPGTPLDRRLEKILACMPHEPEAALEYLRAKADVLLQPVEEELPWDRAIAFDPRAWDSFNRAGGEAVDAPPLETGSTHPIVPLEKYLEAGRGLCIHKAILCALLLERLHIPCRLVNGAVAHGPGETSGHTWVELADGRVLDPAWRMLAPKGERDPNFPDRFKFGDSFRFENQRFPYLVAPAA